MSELKYYKLFHRTSALTSPEFVSVAEFGAGDEVYLKSEADKVFAEKDEKIDELEERIDELQKATDSAWSKVNAMYDELRHNKYKRCLAMAKYWGLTSAFTHGRINLKCMCRESKWLKLAEKFKEAK